ncbi:PREDICTED: BRCA1-associated protein-like isoform X2 [Tarenaya hassleriana]|uniref:BRCA1-associated protein-like isoform X2 n=1 Tax=Tarenaya hassleriana TaxID=28532 RepID=UPI00053C1EE4|nr:PREDICTED: BRCA1-associated protein-like isoform X2 [Tarenaya hassleriana]
MFILRVHSVDAERPASVEDDISGFISVSRRAQSAGNPKLTPKLNERRGVVHLYRNSSRSALPNPNSRSSSLFVLAVPNYFSTSDFVRFCDSHIDNVSEFLFFRNDEMEDRYSVLITLPDQSTADGLYKNLNGRPFAPSEAEICHILYVLSVEYTESDELAGSPPAGFTELPTCPICLERLDPDTSGVLSSSKWTYLSCQVCRLCQQQNEIPSCSICGTTENIWTCLVCGFLGCGRYKEGHSIKHWKQTHHCYSLDSRTRQILDYIGDVYVHRLNRSKVDGISRFVFDSKVDSIVREYNDLLISQLRAQRQYYEYLIIEARRKQEINVSEAIELAVAAQMEELQSNIEKSQDDKNGVAEVNRNLVKDQKALKKMARDIEQREVALLKSKDETILDLEEQIRDIRVYIEAQKIVKDMPDSDTIREGTVLPIPRKEPSSSSRKKKKSGRRRN